MAFGGVFTIQGEEEFSSVSCGRVLISLTLHLIHSVSISLSLASSRLLPSPGSAPNVLSAPCAT